MWIIAVAHAECRSFEVHPYTPQLSERGTPLVHRVESTTWQKFEGGGRVDRRSG